MAYTCILGLKTECDGCMQCQERCDYEPCTRCGKKYPDYDLHYIDGEFVCDDCLIEMRYEEEEEEEE